MKLWINQFTPLLLMPSGKHKYFDLNAGVVVETSKEIATDPKFTGVIYVNSEGKAFHGWINNQHIEPYIEGFPKNCVEIPFQTANPNDFEQYMIWQGQKQVNMCGEMCVAYILGLPLKDVLENWTVKSPGVIKRISGKGKWAGTGPDDLVDLFAVFGQKAHSLSTILPRYNLTSLLGLKGNVIVSCNIGQDGRFRGRDILHWVVVVNGIRERQWGFVEVYNPAPNRIERYSWNEFLASCGQPYGVVLED